MADILDIYEQDGTTYLDLSDDYYQHLLECKARNIEARYEGAEELRLWLQVHYGTQTIEEGLRACPTWMLSRMLYQPGLIDDFPIFLSQSSVEAWRCTTILGLRLVERESARTEALGQTTEEAISPW